MVVGTSDLGLTLEGPTGENSSLIFSMRRSYLQFVFEALGLPFLPIYNDYQFKWTARPDDKNAITVIGLGALDDFELNLSIADDTSPPITWIKWRSSARSTSRNCGTTPRASGGTTTGTTGNGRWWPAETCSTTEPLSTSTTTWKPR